MRALLELPQKINKKSKFKNQNSKIQNSKFKIELID
jgi:hypothetical protein